MDLIEDSALDAAVAAIASAARRRIVERLSRGPATVGELATLLGIGLPATLKHLGLLVDAGLVSRRKVGRTVTVTLVPGALAPLAAWALRTRLFWTNQLDHLAAHLAAPPPGPRPASPTAEEHPS